MKQASFVVRFAPVRFLATTLLAVLLLPAGSTAQIVQKASYVDGGSFTLPPQGSEAPEGPRALAWSAVDRSVHVAGDERGRVFVYDSTGTFLRAYGQQQLENPVAVALDSEGRSYVLDDDANRTWIFGPDGEVAGDLGSGDDDLETLDDPVDLDVGPSGYVYVLDDGRQGVQVYSRDGTFIRRVRLGEGVGAPRGVTVARNGTIYVSDEDADAHVLEYDAFVDRTWSVTSPGGPSGRVPLRGADLDEPRRLAVTPFGRVLVMDESRGRLWTRNPATEETAGPNDLLYGGSGSGRGSFQDAVDVALAGDDAVLILDRELRKVEKIRIAFEEDGSELPAFGYPFRVTRGPARIGMPLGGLRHPEGGEPIFLRAGESSVRLVPTRSQRFTTAYGDDARLFVPDEDGEVQIFGQGVEEVGSASLNEATLVVSDPGEDRFAVFSREDGTLAGTFGDDYDDQRSLDDPEGIAVLDDGRVAIADNGNDRVVIFSADFASLIGSYALPSAYGLAASPRGELVAWNEEGGTVIRIAAQGTDRRRLPANLLPERVSGAAFDQQGNLFLMDRESGRVTVLDPMLEQVLTRIGTGGQLEEPRGLAADREGNVYLTDADDDGSTFVYRWDVHSPVLTGLAFDHREEPRFRWDPGPGQFIRSYQVQGASSPDGPFQILSTTPEPELALQADSATANADPGSGTARFVRVAPVIVNGEVGEPTPVLPIVDYTAVRAYEAESWERALEDAELALELVEAGELEVSEDVRVLLPWIAFEAAYRTGAYGRAVERVGELDPEDLASDSLETAYHELVPQAYQRAGQSQRALDAAREALDRSEEGALELDDETRTELMWVAFTSAFERENYRAVVGWGERLGESVSSARRVEFFTRLPRAQLFLGQPDSAALSLLAIGGDDPRADYYQDSTVVDLSFDIYRELRDFEDTPAFAASEEADGGAAIGSDEASNGPSTPNPGLRFLREYVRSIPGSAGEIRAAYQDSLLVFETRTRLEAPIEHWQNADYAQVVRTLQSLLEGDGELPPETEVVGRQLLAAALFTFDRREDAADAFEGILEVRPDFGLREEAARLEELYGLEVFGPDMMDYFGGLLPGGSASTDPAAPDPDSTDSDAGGPAAASPGPAPSPPPARHLSVTLSRE